MTPLWAEVQVGDELPPLEYRVRRVDLVMYAGASGDFNFIHWNERIAKSVGLPDVIAHGMHTMGEASRIVTQWAGDPGRVLEYGCRFTKPIPVPDDEAGALVEVSAKIVAKNDDGTVTVAISARSGDANVLGKAQALVRLG